MRVCLDLAAAVGADLRGGEVWEGGVTGSDAFLGLKLAPDGRAIFSCSDLQHGRGDAMLKPGPPVPGSRAIGRPRSGSARCGGGGLGGEGGIWV